MTGRMLFRFFRAFCPSALVALALIGPMSPVYAASLLSNWNLIVENNVSTSSEVDGSALVGGSLASTSNYSIHGVTDAGGDGLAVGGNLGPGNIQVNNGGNLRLGGTNLATINLNGGGTLIHDSSVAASVAADFVTLNALNSSIALLTPNGTVDGAGNMTATPTLISGQLVAVYDITQASLAGLGQLNLNFGTANTVIINLTANGSGGVNLVAPPNLNGGFSQANSSHILWNMINATQVTVNNSFSGALLAPHADLKLLGGGINGSVAVESLSNQSAEIRRFTYTGYLPTVPEPSSLLLAATGICLAGLGFVRRALRRQLCG